MEWNKAGRPRKNPTAATIADDKPWTKNELSIQCGVVALARAVVKRWVDDGRPESEKFGVMPWLNILCTSVAADDEKHRRPDEPRMDVAYDT